MFSFCRWELSLGYWQEILVDVFYYLFMTAAAAVSFLFCGMYFPQSVNWALAIAIFADVGMVLLVERIASAIYENC